MLDKSRLHLVAKTIMHTKINSCLVAGRHCTGTHATTLTGQLNLAQMRGCKNRLICPHAYLARIIRNHYGVAAVKALVDSLTALVDSFEWH